MDFGLWFSIFGYILAFFIKSAFNTTLIDENAMAPAAIDGLKSSPVNGYNIPAATGIVIIL